MILRTRVGIVEWAVRATHASAVELRVADRLGALVPGAPSARAKVDLARLARHHGFHAELWRGVVPVLHDRRVPPPGSPSSDLALVFAVVDADGLAAASLLSGAIPALLGVYREWRAEAGPIADAPVLRVLDLVLADEPRDADAGAAILASPAP
jgi:hypothetical protein